MANLVDMLGGFSTGDLVFTYYPPPETSRQPIHVTVFLADGDAPSHIKGAGFVHAGKDEVEVVPVAAYKQYDVSGFKHVTTTDSQRRIRAAEVAKVFAMTTVKTPYGSYPGSGHTKEDSPGANRFTGMIKSESVAALPFDFTALTRLLKWTNRAHKKDTLSVNRGITCAAFATACYQVGEMMEYVRTKGALDKLEKCLYAADKMLESKSELRLRKGLKPLMVDPKKKKQVMALDRLKNKTPHPVYKGQALRDNSNRQIEAKRAEDMFGYMKKIDPGELYSFYSDEKKLGSNLSDIDQQWLYLQTEFLGIDKYSAQSITEVIPNEFMFDAKYMNSRILETHISAQNGWKTTIIPSYS